MAQHTSGNGYVSLAAEIVSAYVSKNAVPVADLPALIGRIHDALNKTAQGATESVKQELNPAVPIKKSITPDYLICLDDGKKFKSLKRHLRTHYNMTPEQYRAKWGLPPDYPMVAANYAKQRSELATRMGLGLKRRVARRKVEAR